jgi:hypothetical protein
MQALNDNDLLRIWEQGRTMPIQRRALAILISGCPNNTWDDLVELSVGERDRRLIRLRELTFGPSVKGLALCGHCHEQMELTVDTRELTGPRPVGEPTPVLVAGMQHHITLRPPTTADLLALDPEQSLDQARRQLIRRCVVSTGKEGQGVVQHILSDEVIDSLPAQASKSDPMDEVYLDVRCPSCKNSSQVLFDIVQLLWDEIATAAKRLLWEIHHLARAYAWREADILTMSSSRRQMYLEMVGA